MEHQSEGPGIEEALKRTARHIEELAELASRRVETTVDLTKAKLGQVGGDLAESGRELVRETDYYVHENPWKSIGIAAGLGLIAGLLLRR